jgi:hypothetical protein
MLDKFLLFSSKLSQSPSELPSKKPSAKQLPEESQLLDKPAFDFF